MREREKSGVGVGGVLMKSVTEESFVRTLNYQTADDGKSTEKC